MSAHRMNPLPRVDLSDPAAVTAWAMKIESKLTSMRPLITDATTRKIHRRYSRRYLRSHLTRDLRDMLVMLEAILPASAPQDKPEAPSAEG